MKKQTGFTLIEIMVVIIIVGILAAIAIPNFSEHITRSRIAQATSGLAERRARMEQFFQDNHTYYQAPGADPVANPAIASPACATDNSSSQHFDFTCPNPTATTYTLIATGKGAMTGFTYTINQANVKATTAAQSGWSTSATCWITSKGASC